MRDTRGKLAMKIDALQRLIMWYTLSGVVPYYLVTEYPKSGGSWFSQMLAAYLETPFPRCQRPPSFFQPYILHGHHLHSPRFHNVFCVIRDGRDVMVSAYYHNLFHSDKNSPWAVDEARNRVPFVDYECVEKNMPRFIEHMFTEARRGFFNFSWDEFVYSWMDKDVPIIRYESLLENTVDAMCEAIRKVTAEEPDIKKLRQIAHEFSFEKQAGRKRGEEDQKSFLRKGIAGDWKNKFTKEACEVFDHFAGDALIEIGYENDRSWIEHPQQ